MASLPNPPRQGWLSTKLFSTSAFLLGARLLGAGAGFLVQLILARWLSPQELGVYFPATSLVVVGGFLASHGYPSIATRFVSRYRGPGGAVFLRRFVWRAQSETFILALAITALVMAGAAWWPGIDSQSRIAILLAAATIPFVASFRIYGSLAASTRAFRLAYLPDVCLKPVVLLVGLGLLLLAKGDIGLVEVMLVLGGATIVLSLAQRVLLARELPVALNIRGRLGSRRAGSQSVEALWRRQAHAVLLVAVFAQYLPELSILLATPILGASDIGVFGLCLKLAFLVGFFVLMTQTIATPDIADALGRGGEGSGGSKLAASCFAATGVSLLATLACALWGDEVLRLFGPNFVAGHAALVMLVATQLVRATFGPTNAVLTLVGAQKTNLAVTALGMAVLALSTLVLGALFGLNGAAAALLATVLFWSAISAIMLHRTAGVRVDLLSAIGSARAAAASEPPLSPSRQPSSG